MHKKYYLLIAALVVIISVISFNFMGKNMQNKPLIDREVFFGNPDRISVKISPDGSYLSYIAPLNGVLNVYVAPIDDILKAKPVTNDKNRGIRNYSWTYKKDVLIYSQDVDGDEDFHLYKVDLKTDKITDITPFEKIRAYVFGSSLEYPNLLMIGLNNRNPNYHDVYQYNFDSGELKLILQNDKYASFIINEKLDVVYASIMHQDTGDAEFFDISNRAEPKSFLKIPSNDVNTTNIIGFNQKGDKLYYVDSRNRNLAGLFEFNTKDSTSKLLAENSKADLEDIIVNPVTSEFEGYSVEYIKNETIIINDLLKADFDLLKSKGIGELHIVSRPLKDDKWIVAYTTDTGPIKYYLFDRSNKESKFLFVNNSALANEEAKLSPMEGLIIQSRDGLDLVSYLTLPKSKLSNGKLDKPLPLVLIVHGGPRARDGWGYDPQHQWLADRGYAVLSVNYRSSTGFGKNFINAGNGQWGTKMHDDLLDAVNWAVAKGYADKNNVAIFGGSYGGYAALVGLTFTPDFFTCGVDIVGPSNLTTLINSIPSYWAPFRKSLIDMIGGDPDTEQGREFLKSRSPLSFVSNIKKPLLIGQGANDPRVKQAESDQIVAAMKANKIPGTYVLYPDEGHGFAKPNNRMSFYAIAEEFLGSCMNMPYQEVGNTVQNSSAVIEKY
jgi:dipeptidyl aminopeptidase/acylaminoacyl peptidase